MKKLWLSLLALSLISFNAQAAYNPNAIDQVIGDVTATGNTTGIATATVASVGGSTAASVHSTVVEVAAAATTNTPNTLVIRNGSGNIDATSIPAANLASTANGGVTGILPVANGGTGDATLTANNLLVGAGTSAVTFIAPGTSGNVLTSNGTSFVSAAPASSTPFGSPACTVTITASATIAASTCVLLVNASSGAVVVTLQPAASSLMAQVIKKIDSSANTVTIAPPSGTLDSVANYVESLQNASITVSSDLTNYWIQ